jgi:hypothetical protein
MSLVDELRELAAGATPGAIVPPSADVRRITTTAADEIERLRAALEEIAGYVDTPGRPVLAIMAREALR